jgi:hypothetical protein
MVLVEALGGYSLHITLVDKNSVRPPGVGRWLSRKSRGTSDPSSPDGLGCRGYHMDALCDFDMVSLLRTCRQMYSQPVILSDQNSR